MADEVLELVIHRIEYDITRNGDICTRVWKDNETAIFFHSDSHYLITRVEGDKITYKTNTKGFNNIIIPQAFVDMYSSDAPIAKMLKKVHENFRVALNQSKNGVKIGLTDYETDTYIDDNFTDREIFVNKVFDRVKTSEEGYYKYLAQQLDLKKASRSVDPEPIIREEGIEIYREFKKNYKIEKAD